MPGVPQRLDLREEHLNRTILLLAWPAIVENLLHSLVYFADTLVAGWLRDERALAASMVAGTLMFFASSPFAALAMAAASLVSRHWGEGDVERARRCAGQSMALAFLFALGVMAAGWPLAGWAMRALGAEPGVAGLGALYFRIVLLSGLLGLPLMIANGILRGAGDSRTPMLITLVMNLLNVIANIVLAFGWGPIPALGLAGIAWGTVIARTTGGLLALAVLARGRHSVHLPLRSLVTLERPTLARVWRLSAPAMAERVLHSGSHVIFIGIVGLLGTTALAANNIGVHVESLAFMPGFGLSVAVATVVGQAVGAGRPDIAALAVRRTLGWSTAFMVALGLSFVAFGPVMATIFGATPEVIALAGVVLQLSALEHPLMSATMILSGALRGAGDTRSPFWVVVWATFLFRFGAVYLFAITLGWGLPGIWIGTAVDWGGRAIMLWVIFRRGAWRAIHARERALLDAEAAGELEMPQAAGG